MIIANVGGRFAVSDKPVVRYEVEQGIGVITVDNPPVNALGPGVGDGIMESLDKASVIANGMIEGKPIGLMEQIGYYIITATAGHDTTSSALAGAMHLLSTHPDALARIQADPATLTNAIEEMLRRTAPVRHFMR